jgi:hypothetical protein
MSQVKNEHLLTAKQMAQFVTDGYLKFDAIVPQQLNDKINHEQRTSGIAGHEFWEKSAYMQQAFALPQVKGIIQSLLGEHPGYDHSYNHTVAGQNHRAQEWHADSIIDTRHFGFDIQIFYFSHDAPKESGPTLVLPGSHLRRTNTASIGRYKNMMGQKQLVANAGTMVFWHAGLWHCAQPNYTDNMRYVFKLRLRSGQPQRALFNMDGYDSPEVARILSRTYPWQGDEERLEHVQRAKLWRYVTGDDHIDFSFEGALTRMSLGV